MKDNNKNFAVSGVFHYAMLDVIKSLYGNECDDEYKIRLAINILYKHCGDQLGKGGMVYCIN